MKYEMIFGDEMLFDGAPDECFCVAKNVYDENVYYKAVNACLFWHDGGKWKPLQFMSCTPIAMRRIIKEPKQWTWEDKKAGRLPEVGCKCVWVDLSDTESPDDLLYPEVGEEIEIVANTKTYDGKYQVSVFKWLHDDGETQCYAASGHVEDFKPIETPAEKAQRLEDEFVESTCRQNEPHSTLYSDGVRAAYRKLKGGE